MLVRKDIAQRMQKRRGRIFNISCEGVFVKRGKEKKNYYFLTFLLQDQGVTTVMQMVPEEAIGTEDSAILLQDDTQPEPTAIEHVTGEDSLIEEAEETRQLIEDPNTCEAPVLEPKLQRAVSSMCAQVGITQTAVRQGGTLRGDQQVEAVSKMNDLLQLMVNVQLKSADYEQVCAILSKDCNLSSS